MIDEHLRDDGILVLAWNLPDHPTNVLSATSIPAFAARVAAAMADPAVRGVVVTSAKRDFLAGADLTSILPGNLSHAAYLDRILGFHRLWRDIELAPKPVVAAINGTALGGGCELALACHGRIAADVPAARIGLPEVTLGLLPGGGGTQRLPRLIGVEAALPLILEGRTVTFRAALDLGMLDEIVAPADLLETACRRALGTGPDGRLLPRDRAGAPAPDGAALAATLDAAEARLIARTRGHLNAPARALAALRQGLPLPLDEGLEVEARHFVDCCFDPQATNIIRTMFFGTGAARKLAARPAGIAPRGFRKVGVLGAGMMGNGIAQISAAAGLEVVMIDTTLAQAEAGLAAIGQRLRKAAERAGTDPAATVATLARITATEDFAALADVDLIVEAVFEDRAVKADVTRRALAVAPEGIVFASNTSTLPITGLAKASPRPDLVIGMHFFSPVDRMALVELIRGAETSDLALAHALDFVKLLRKTPIVVRDGRGFYTSRVFAHYIYEALEMLEEGIDPALIEQGGLAAGFPMSPLALSDQLSIELAYRVLVQERQDTGDAFEETAAYRVCRLMVDELGRKGRKSGGGYYDYPDSGEKQLWPGLASHFPRAAQQPSVEHIAQRLLAIQSLETLRCLDEGVLPRAIEGDIGAVLGWGYPAFRGGPVAHVHTMGTRRFLALCDDLAARHGKRYEAPAWLRDLAARSDRIYPDQPHELEPVTA